MLGGCRDSDRRNRGGEDVINGAAATLADVEPICEPGTEEDRGERDNRIKQALHVIMMVAARNRYDRPGCRSA